MTARNDSALDAVSKIFCPPPPPDRPLSQARALERDVARPDRRVGYREIVSRSTDR